MKLPNAVTTKRTTHVSDISTVIMTCVCHCVVQTVEYDLMSVLYHVGSHANAGHYITAVRQLQDWIVCDDDTVCVHYW